MKKSTQESGDESNPLEDSGLEEVKLDARGDIGAVAHVEHLAVEEDRDTAASVHRGQGVRAASGRRRPVARAVVQGKRLAEVSVRDDEGPHPCRAMVAMV